MPDSVECFAYIAKYDAYLFSRVNCFTKRIVDVSDLICSRVPANGSLLKGSNNIVGNIIIVNMFVGTTFHSSIVECFHCYILL